MKIRYKGFNFSLLIFAGIIYISSDGCQSKDRQIAAELASIDLSRGDLILCNGQNFGEVSFSSGCDIATREDFNLAVSLLHSFEYDEAEKAFTRVLDRDPSSVMAYWGVAMSLYTALWAPPDQTKLEKASKLLNLAAKLPRSTKETEYLEAIGAYYDNWQSLDPKIRAGKFEAKMKAIHQKYPDDLEVAVFYALTLNATADPTDKTYSNQKKAGAILEPIFADYPNHPGIAHYIIHSYDNPLLAPKALDVDRKYAVIAPASAHALHMPSHIFTRMGLWDESINSNISSIAAAVCYTENAGFEGHWDEELHGMDYWVYAYLQEGKNTKAKELNTYLNSFEKLYPVNFKIAYALAAIPVRIALENKDWKTAAALQLSSIKFPWQNFPWQKAILHFGRAHGSIHLGKLDLAQKEIEMLQTLREELINKNNNYEVSQVLVQIKAADAWLSFVTGNNTKALKLMSEAADLEDHTSKHPVTPCEVLPARELLAELYLAMDNPQAAIIEYEKDLIDHPNRLNALYGSVLASQKLNDVEAVQKYSEKVEKLLRMGDESREITTVLDSMRNKLQFSN